MKIKKILWEKKGDNEEERTLCKELSGFILSEISRKMEMEREN